MKLLPKPEGYDLRDKRSDKTKDAALWTPADALFDTSEVTGKQNVEALFVAWRQVKDDGSTETHFRFSGDKGKGESLMLNAIGRFMGWFS